MSALVLSDEARRRGGAEARSYEIVNTQHSALFTQH